MKTPLEKVDQLDDLIDAFERAWKPSDADFLLRWVKNQPGCHESAVLVELIRADIGRCYATGQDVNLNRYFEQFPHLREMESESRAICFEDYRGRQQHGLSCQVDRWSQFPAVEGEPWFQALVASLSRAKRSSSSGISKIAVQDHAADDSGTGISNDPRTSLKLGDFELLMELGRGAFSRVYLARQMSLAGRYVAIKVVTRPLDEPFHLARLQHTGIIPLYSFHRIEGKWILCMPYHGSATLADWMTHHQKPESRSGQSLIETVRAAQVEITTGKRNSDSPFADELRESVLDSLQRWHQANGEPLSRLASFDARDFCLWIFTRLAAALAHAHQRGIVHGDLKPANILIRNDGEPALIDFNLAGNNNDGPQEWRGGTLPYMAPEQLQSMMSRSFEVLRPEGDVYSLGVIVYELLEGRLPYGLVASKAEADLADALEARRKAPLFSGPLRVPSGLRAILSKCLQARAEDRYPSAVTLLEDLEREVAHLPLRHAREPFLTGRVFKLVRRYPRLFAAGSVLTVSGLVVSLLVSSLRESRERNLRLEAAESYAEFRAASDEVFLSFLDATSTPAADRSAQKAELLTTAFHSVGLVSSPDAAEMKWNRVYPELSEAEQHQLEQRLLAVSFFATHHILQSESQQSSSQATKAGADNRPIAADPDTELRQSLKCLPHVLSREAMNSSTCQFVQSLLSKADTSHSGLLNLSDIAVSQIKIAHTYPAGHQVRQPLASELEYADVDAILTATSQLMQQRPEQTLQTLESAEAPDSLRLIYWMSRGRAQMEQLQFRDAVTSFTSAMRYTDQIAAPTLNRGIALYRLGSLEEARLDLTEAIRLAPEDPTAYINRFAVLVTQGNADAALKDLNRAIELQPESNRLLLIRSRALRQAGRLREAKQDFETAMQVPPKDHDDYLSVALAHLPDSPQLALRDLLAAEAKFGPTTAVLQTMAHVYSEHLQQPNSAIQCLGRLLNQEPEFQKAIAGRAVLYARQGQAELARKDVELLDHLSVPPTPEARYQAACALALCSRKETSLREQSVRMLATAVQQGYGGELLTTDPDLEPIRSLPEFDAICRTYQLIAEPSP